MTDPIDALVCHDQAPMRTAIKALIVSNNVIQPAPGKRLLSSFCSLAGATDYQR